jgi:hypothetical protein
MLVTVRRGSKFHKQEADGWLWARRGAEGLAIVTDLGARLNCDYNSTLSWGEADVERYLVRASAGIEDGLRIFPCL